MRQTRLLMVVAVACVTIAVGMAVSTHIVRGQSSPPIYNPYPTGILPSDIASEETRVQTEIAGIEKLSSHTVASINTSGNGRQPANTYEHRLCGTTNTRRLTAIRLDYISIPE